MNAIHFRARDAADALGQIRSRLGADAVVLSVAQVPAQGVRRLWRKPQLEVLAGLPEIAAPWAPPMAGRAASLNVKPPCAPAIASTKTPADRKYLSEEPASDTYEKDSELADPGPPGLGGNWRSGAFLHQLGLLPLHVEKVLERARASSGGTPPASFGDELALVQSALASFWRPESAADDSLSQVHVFIGPPGSGKTTVLCKWMANAVLSEGCKARAWRLDNRAANFAGLVDLYGEILGVPIEREWRPNGARAQFDVGFIDLPGFHAEDASAVQQLRGRLEAIPNARVHLVLNAAYDAAVLLAQARAFSTLPVADVIFTHLDEEGRRGKLWNILLGTNFRVRFLSGGQNIPGGFIAASPNNLFPANFKLNTPGALVVDAARRIGRHLASR